MVSKRIHKQIQTKFFFLQTKEMAKAPTTLTATRGLS